MQGERQDVDAKRPTSSPRNVRRRRCRPIMLDCCSFGQHFCFALLFYFFYRWPAFQLHEKRALLLFIDLCAGIDFSSDDIYPHFLFAFRAIHRETKRQCILINLCFRLIVASRAINPYRFCGTFICQTVCFFWCRLLLQTSTVLPSPNAMHTHFDICFHRKPHYPPQCSVPRPHRRRAGYRG